MSLNAIAKALGVHKSTVQFHRDGLVAAGALLVSGGRYRKGPAYALEGGAESDRAPPGIATAPWLITDGSRTIEILRAPAMLPDTMPGFVKTTLVGRGAPDKKRQDHMFRGLFDGRTFHLLLMQQPNPQGGHGWSLQMKKVSPPPRLSQVDAAGIGVEMAWDQYVLAGVKAWAAGAGVEVANQVRRSRPVSLALPHVVDAALKFRSQDVDADGTPDPGTVEVRTQALKESLETLPESLAAIAQQLNQVQRQVDGLTALVAQEATLAEKIVGVQAGQARAMAATLSAMVPAAQPSVPSFPPSNPGVEYA